MPLFQTELGIKRDSVSQATINMILEDPEAETYQFVVKAVLDNGTRTLATLADRVNRLTDEVHYESVRTALLHKKMADHDRLQEELKSFRRNLELSRQAERDARLQAEECQRQYEALLHTKIFRLLNPLRRIYGRLRSVAAAPPRSETP